MVSEKTHTDAGFTWKTPTQNNSGLGEGGGSKPQPIHKIHQSVSSHSTKVVLYM